MRTPQAGSWLVVTAVVVAVFSPLVLSTAGQAPYRAPRFAGTQQPDLSGIWQAVNTANWDIQAHAAQIGVFPNLLGTFSAVPAGLDVVEGHEIPYQPWALEKKKENFKNRLTVDPFNLHASGDPEAKCYLPGVPRATYMPFPFQILQSTNKILISYEYASTTRIIHMDVHKQAPIDTWMGWSNGRWEGDTLVVDVTGFNDMTWFDRAGNFHSDALHVVERYTPASPYHLTYEATIEDPKVFTRPWKISMPLYRRIDKDMQRLEFECVLFTEEFIWQTLRKPAAEP